MSRNPHYIKMINSNKWKLLRAKKLQSNPVCEVCEANNRSTLATEVHHTVPVESVPHELGMRQLMFDYNNLQSLCHSCHSDAHDVLSVIRKRRFRRIIGGRRNVLRISI